MLTRREFGGTLLAAPLASGAAYRPTLAGQAYVWTQQFRRDGRTLADGVDAMIAAHRRAGLRHIELISDFLKPEVWEATRASLKQHELSVPIVYAGGAMHTLEQAEKSIASILETAALAKQLGARYINTNPNPRQGKEPKTAAELDVQAKQVNALAAALPERGLGLLLHHHDPEMMNGAREWYHLLRNTDPKRVGLCLDIDWIIQGGQKPMEILEASGSRLRSLHLRNAAGGVWTEWLGEGEYDYKAVAGYLQRTGFDGYLVVELALRENTKITAPLHENLRRSAEWAKSVFEVRG